MNKQEIFNQVYLGLKSQGFKRSTAFADEHVGTCRYRGYDGRKCAIGHLISDEEYSIDLEGSGIYYLLKHTFTDISPPFPVLKMKSFFERLEINNCTDHIDFLRSLQRVHDEFEDMQAGLKSIAATHGLTIPEDAQ
jgi:hypothetical protein